MNDEQFSKLLNYFSFSWAGYRKVRKGVKKRIARHMTESGCRDMDEYIHRLETDRPTRSECERLLSVPISRFFRDHRLWEVLPEKILPLFWSKKSVRVWCAGCSGGEEVYSLKITREILNKKHSNLPDLKVTACDLNSENIKRARKGVYSQSSFKETKPDILKQFFEKGPTRKSLAVKSYLKNNITWEACNLIHDQLFQKKYDIIFLRNNILTYAADNLKLTGLNNVVSALADAGILIIGAKESLPESMAGFEHFELPYVFQKQGCR